jgi:hypothetical protein
MVQLYFLSILCNGLSGYILFAVNENDPVESGSRFSLNNPTFHLVLGVLSAVTGVLKLLDPMKEAEGKVVYLLGDLLPAAAGVTAGLLLIFGIYRTDVSATNNPGALDRLGTSLMKFRKTVGLALFAIAFLHFLLPRALFL